MKKPKQCAGYLKFPGIAGPFATRKQFGACPGRTWPYLAQLRRGPPPAVCLLPNNSVLAAVLLHVIASSKGLNDHRRPWPSASSYDRALFAGMATTSVLSGSTFIRFFGDKDSN
ncbi:hypothetical protein EVAR_88069_1 [Eumeta japonica]|uniref:Uncharacterized protein n=1 Tax=Eumeta variegata TaxID=151549 RepID=A0A4C1WJC8_EUMVA|nr:hypothetical protein EVAR_88069_1 [Eumeta japonica]